jgi:hypothetical protein
MIGGHSAWRASPAAPSRGRELPETQNETDGSPPKGRRRRAPRHGLGRLGSTVGQAGAIATGILALTAVATMIFDLPGQISDMLSRSGTVALPLAYPHERWREATLDDFTWLGEAGWCVPEQRAFLLYIPFENTLQLVFDYLGNPQVDQERSLIPLRNLLKSDDGLFYYEMEMLHARMGVFVKENELSADRSLLIRFRQIQDDGSIQLQSETLGYQQLYPQCLDAYGYQPA